ncbi:hypothetical protein [Pseudochrobactrum sp. MP213Fo]|uniref:hypothetical protein n=1 Tax=Pseudochrobactrum sp. MP213Fo TaxID=3022250 RepID=UPI003BA0D015
MSNAWARDRAFSVAEAAQLADMPESTLRDWLASGGNPFMSGKFGSQRRMSATDVFITIIAKRLIAANYQILVATCEAWRVAGGPQANVAAIPRDSVFVAQPSGGMASVEVSPLFEAGQFISETGSIVIPAGILAADLVEKASALYGEAA